MTTTTTTPNMNLVKPNVGEDPGPDWATNLNGDLDSIDSHDHSTGQGVQIGVAGINIDGSLVMNEQNLTQINAALFTQINAALTSLLRSLQVVSKDLYYVDGDGNSVRITQGGSVTGATGTITGLPSGTASAAFSAGTFTFSSATNTKATMSVGPVAIGSTTINGKQTTLASAAAMPANLTLTLPQAAGVANSVLSNDGSSNTTWSAITTILTAAGIGSSQTASALAVAMVDSGYKEVTSISLTAGTWLISGGLNVVGTLGHVPGQIAIAISTTTASTTGTVSGKSFFFNSDLGTAADAFATIPGFVVTPGSTTIYYLNGFVADSNIEGDGSITAVRIA